MAVTLKVLAVDDEDGMRTGVSRILRSYQLNLADIETEVEFKVETAASGEECIEKLDKQEYNILLLDHKMPGMTGLDVLGWIDRRYPPEVRPRDAALESGMQTIMVTAYASLDTAVEAMKLGAYDFLAKPFTPEELRSVVRKAATHLMVQRRVKEMEAEKRRVRFQFISVLAHELKAPLGAIEGYLQIMEDGSLSDDPDKQQHMIARCLTRIHGMRRLIFDLLDMTRIESGEKARHLAELDMVGIARNAIETVQPEADKRSISISLQCPDSLPLTGDSSEIEIIFNNLLTNAVKYNRDSGSVVISLDAAGGLARIEVRDTGIGMTADEQERLFKEFSRIKNEHTRHVLGTGLGLSTIRKLARLYGGDVSVESEPGVGSTFTVMLKQQAEASEGGDNGAHTGN